MSWMTRVQFPAGAEIFPFSVTTSILALRMGLGILSLWVKQVGKGDDCSPPSAAEVKHV